MKTRKTFALLGGATLLGVLSVAATALAASWGGYARITHLETSGDGGYRVYYGAASNPNGCASADYAELMAGRGAADIDLMNKTLLAAMLAGKEVKFWFSTVECGPTGRPAYAALRVRN